MPHFFEQTYDTDAVWAGVRVVHPFFGTRAEVEAAVTPAATRLAEDFDTFFQPDGNVVVSGTTGNATLRSMRVAWRVPLARWRSLDLGAGYAGRRDRATFHDGDRIVTTTQPPSETHELVTTRETTVSMVHEVQWFARGGQGAGRGRFDWEATVTPIALGRQAIDLPDKYPGQTLIYAARFAALAARVTYRQRVAGVCAGLGVDAGRTFNWSRADQLHLRGGGFFVELTSRCP